MSDKQFFNNLSATYADVRKLDVKKINLKGKNILEYIEENKTVLKHANDTRTTVTDNDLWGQWVETLEDGTLIIHDEYIQSPTAANNNSSQYDSVTKVEDNKAYVGDTLFANIQFERLKNGSNMFCYTDVKTFSSDLNSLENGHYMFKGSTQFREFNSDLKSLTNGNGMFYATALASFSSDLGSLSNGMGMFFGCSNLATFTSDLPNLTNGQSMFVGCTNLTLFSRDLPNLTNGKWMFSSCYQLVSFNSELSSLVNGQHMFQYCSELKSFGFDLPNLQNGSWMFYDCNFTSFTADLPSLTNGEEMFSACPNLASISSDLPNLTNGKYMFSTCPKLTTFSSNLDNLTNGYCMFQYCDALASFSSDLPNLTNGCAMFFWDDKLTSFSSDLSSLIYGYGMFEYCYGLTRFTSDLSSLMCGSWMFACCKLDAQSVMYIVHSINDIVAEKQLYSNGTIPYVTVDTTTPTHEFSARKGFMSDGGYVYTFNDPEPYTTTIPASDVGKLTISIDVTNNSSTIAQQLQTFAEGTLFDSWADLKQAFVDKGWTVTWQYGGGNTSITYDLRGGERIIPCPVYTRLIEILPEGIEHDEEGNEVGEKFYTDEQKKLAQYCNEDGTKFYDIEWGHDVTHPEEFQQFDSLETACVTYGVMPKEYLETNGQTTLF